MFQGFLLRFSQIVHGVLWIDQEHGDMGSSDEVVVNDPGPAAFSLTTASQADFAQTARILYDVAGLRMLGQPLLKGRIVVVVHQFSDKPGENRRLAQYLALRTESLRLWLGRLH